MRRDPTSATSQDIRAKNCDDKKQQTRIIPKDDEELQDGNRRDRNYKSSQENKLPSYPAM